MLTVRIYTERIVWEASPALCGGGGVRMKLSDKAEEHHLENLT